MSKRILAIPTAVIVLGVAFLVSVAYYLDHWGGQPLPVTDEKHVVVRPGMTFLAVADHLADANIVDPRLFSLLAKRHGLQKAVQSGEYRVAPGETAHGLLRRLTTGDVVVHRFRIPEGGTLATVLGDLHADDSLHFDLADATAENLLQRIGLPPRHAEGLFFPDTYQFRRGQKASTLLRRAYARMERKLAKAWAERDPLVAHASPYEALILASIVEKETAHESDRPLVAGVFARRLREGMRLQSDPTVVYGLGDAFDGNLTRAHLRADGVYNTYRRAGLPPTPIAMPSLAAIQAVMHPTLGDALYFVSRGDGTSEFSATLAEHNAAVRRYQLQ